MCPNNYRALSLRSKIVPGIENRFSNDAVESGKDGLRVQIPQSPGVTLTRDE